MKKIILIITILALITLAGCTEERAEQEQLTIIASSFPLYEFAREIAPNENVEMLIQPGADVHHYDLKPSDLIKLERAELIIFTGEEMEPWLERVLELDGKHKGRTLQATKKVELIRTEDEHEHGHDDEHGHEHDEHDDEHDDEHGHEYDEHDDEHDDGHGHEYDEHEDDHHHHHHSEYDPHVWLDFDNSIKIVNAIAQRLSEIKPEKRDEFEENAKEYITKIEEINTKYEQELANCEIRHFITNHDSFRYLAQKYDLKQIPIRGLSAEQEPSPRTIANIIHEAQEHEIKHVFFEELASPRVSEAIAQEIGAETLMLTPAENVPARDFGEKTFIDLMNENLNSLKIGLRCE